MIFLNQHNKFEELFPDFYWWGYANLLPSAVYASLQEGEFPAELRGNFAFVYATPTDTWMCVDHLATCPLYYTDSNKIFHNLTAWIGEVGARGLNAVSTLQRGMFGFCYTIGDLTPYSGIYQVPPEHYWHNDQVVRYSDVARPKSYEWDSELYRNLLGAAVNQIPWQRYYTTISMLFSSGRDSAVVASAIAQGSQKYKHQVDYYTITHETGKHNEFFDALESGEQLEIAPVDLTANINSPTNVEYEFDDSAWLVKLQTLERHNITGTVITGEVGNVISYGEAGKRLSYYVNRYGEWSSEEIASMLCSHVENFKTTTLNRSSFSDQFARDEWIADSAWQRIVKDVEDTLNRWGFWTSEDEAYKRNCLVNVGCLHHKSFRLRGYSTDWRRKWYHPLADYYVMDYTLGLNYWEREKHDVQKWYYQRAYAEAGPFALAAWNTQVRGLGIKCQD